MPHSSKETLSVGWCDNGMTDGKFTEGLLYTTLTSAKHGIFFNNAVRVQGNQIARQRMDLLNIWADQIKTDWLLWVDSDIVLTADILKKIWDAADKVSRPVVSGVYFVSKGMETTLMTPMPTIFMDTEDEFQVEYIHPLPIDSLIKVDSAGMGLVLMHKSIVPKLREGFPSQNFFQETDQGDGKFIGEDISFFRKLKKVGIEVYAHTGALAQHMKRFSFDVAYYGLYWQEYARQMKIKEEEANAGN
jgi:hypothetical protein